MFKLNSAWRGLSYSKAFISFWLLVFLQATVSASLPVVGGIWLSDDPKYQLSETHEEQLVGSLRRITGFESLHFTKEGLHIPGNPPDENCGSKQARQILQWVMESRYSFIIEDHSGSPTVHFGQLDPGLTHEDALNRLRLTIWRVRLDFKDFREMKAPREVRQTFDAGFTLLHELLHGLGYKDTTLRNEIGECEKFVNQARSELGLPLRDEYFGNLIQSIQGITIVRLRFRSKGAVQQIPAKKPAHDRIHYLFFLIPTDFEPLRGSQDDLHTEGLMKAKAKR